MGKEIFQGFGGWLLCFAGFFSACLDSQFSYNTEENNRLPSGSCRILAAQIFFYCLQCLLMFTFNFQSVQGSLPPCLYLMYKQRGTENV